MSNKKSFHQLGSRQQAARINVALIRERNNNANDMYNVQDNLNVDVQENADAAGNIEEPVPVEPRIM